MRFSSMALPYSLLIDFAYIFRCFPASVPQPHFQDGGQSKGTLDLGVFYETVGGFGTGLCTRSMGEYPVVLVASPQVKKSHPSGPYH